MPAIIVHHSFVAICVIVLIEESGVPLPIPFDLLVLFAGTLAAHSLSQLLLWLVMLTCASSLGSMIFFTIVRRGGRPVVDRFGHYAHLDPDKLARAEAWIQKRGWFGIALGRALPVLRLPVAVVCALLKVPYERYLAAQLVGSAAYILVFLILGALFGPTLLENIHLPRLAIRFAGLLVLAAGLPALLWWLSMRVRRETTPAPTRRQVTRAFVLASVAGAISLSATWAAAAALATLIGSARSLNLSITLAHWLIGGGMRATSAYVVVYSSIVALCIVLGVVYTEALRPRIVDHVRSLVRQALVLALLGCGIVGLVLLPALLTPRLSPIVQWWQAGGLGLVATLALGMLSYSVTTVCGHNLAIATWNRQQPGVSSAGTVTAFTR